MLSPLSAPQYRMLTVALMRNLATIFSQMLSRRAYLEIGIFCSLEAKTLSALCISNALISSLLVSQSSQSYCLAVRKTYTLIMTGTESRVLRALVSGAYKVLLHVSIRY